MLWWSNEMKTAQNTVFFRSDVWSFGILMFELLSIGEMPYSQTKMADYKTRMKAEWE